MIYFPFDQYVITPEAQIGAAGCGQVRDRRPRTSETVVGHTDTSGSVAYNLRLSERRAKATADALVSLGVPQTSLDVSWTGKSDLAVQTGDGVKEPLNRRARSTSHSKRPDGSTSYNGEPGRKAGLFLLRLEFRPAPQGATQPYSPAALYRGEPVELAPGSLR